MGKKFYTIIIFSLVIFTGCQSTEVSKNTNEQNNTNEFGNIFNDTKTTIKATSNSKFYEYNSTVDDADENKSCEKALKRLKKEIGFASTATEQIGFSAYLAKDDYDNDIVTIRVSNANQEKITGDGTVAIYNVHPNGDFELTDEINEIKQCAYGKF